jgi:aldehyde dehydrogenase (NAD+)/betaine-aldehyde dehydrogenase
MMIQAKSFIDGKYVDAKGSIELFNPSAGEVFAISQDADISTVDLAVKSATEVQKSWRNIAVHDRTIILRRISTLMMENQNSLGELESLQTGKPLAQGLRDVELAARYFDFYASAIESLHGTTIPLDKKHLIFTTWQPHGVTGHVIPWNYPLQILARSVAPSLAMGNTCVLKPAEQTPLTALKVAELAIESGLPAGAFNVVVGLGETTGAALTSHPGIKHISFTGSVEVGQIISHSAANNLIPVTMELGGKSPNILFADANLEKAIPVIANAILQNAGQTCSAGSRLLVEESAHDEVVARLQELFANITIGPALSDSKLGPLISEEQRNRVLAYIGRISGDEKIVYGGQALSGGKYGNGYFVEPTIIDHIDPKGILGQEEIFGPVLAVSTFTTIDEAVELANCTEYGLVAGVWTQDISKAHYMLNEIVSGQIFVNTYGASGGVELPFGGFKKSGYGREKGFEGLKGFGAIKTGIISI